MSREYICRTRESGIIVEESVYPVAKRDDSPAEKKAHQRKRDEIVKEYNHRTSVKLLALKLAANFPPGSIVGCFTYDDRHLPPTREQALRCFGRAREKVAAAWRERGADPAGLIWAYATEEKHGDGRMHHHFVCPALGDDFSMLREAWSYYGEIVDFKPLRVDAEKNYDTLAHYMAKEGRERLDLKSWNFSHGARRPVETRDRLALSELPDLPPGVIVVENQTIETPFGIYVYRKYVMPFTADGSRAVSLRVAREAAQNRAFY